MHRVARTRQARRRRPAERRRLPAFDLSDPWYARMMLELIDRLGDGWLRLLAAVVVLALVGFVAIVVHACLTAPVTSLVGAGTTASATALYTWWRRRR